MKKIVLLVFISVLPLILYSQNIARDNKPLTQNNAFTFSCTGIYTDLMKKFNLSTPGITVSVGSTGGCIYAGLDFGMPGGYLYGLHKSSASVCQLFRMDTINANCSLVSNHNYTGNLAGMSFDPKLWVHYILVSGPPAKIFTFSPAGGDLIPVAQLPSNYPVSSFSINNSGSFFGIDETNDNLIKIDKSNGNCTIIGSLGFNANNVSGSDFDPLTGKMYLITQGGSAQEFRFLDTATGSSTLVGTFSGSFIHLAAAGNTFVMPPLPVVPTIIYPTGSINTLTPLMDWTDVQNAALYNIQVSSGPVTVISAYTAQSQYQVPPGVLAPNTMYYWRVRAYNGAGYSDWSLISSFNCIVSGIRQISGDIPDGFSLSQNYPNPFNPLTRIKFSVPSLSGKNGITSTTIVLKVFDINGRAIRTLVNEPLLPGTYETVFDGSSLNSGVYFIQLAMNSEQLAIKKMVLTK